MSDPSERKKKMGLPVKFITGFAVGAALGFGLCGVSIGRSIGGDNWWGNVASIGFGCFLVCMAGLVASLIWFAVAKGSRRDK
jgi:hypothetical protein